MEITNEEIEDIEKESINNLTISINLNTPSINRSEIKRNLNYLQNDRFCKLLESNIFYIETFKGLYR